MRPGHLHIRRCAAIWHDHGVHIITCRFLAAGCQLPCKLVHRDTVHSLQVFGVACAYARLCAPVRRRLVSIASQVNAKPVQLIYLQDDGCLHCIVLRLHREGGVLNLISALACNGWTLEAGRVSRAHGDEQFSARSAGAWCCYASSSCLASSGPTLWRHITAAFLGCWC